jgi:hypothetical protein
MFFIAPPILQEAAKDGPYGTGTGYDILTTDDLFRRSFGEAWLNGKKEFITKV